MKLPLLLHAPVSTTNCPVVLLSKGQWLIESNHIDSEIVITLNHDLLPLENNLKLEIIDDTRVQLTINKSGSESQLTVFAKRIN